MGFWKNLLGSATVAEFLKKQYDIGVEVPRQDKVGAVNIADLDTANLDRIIAEQDKQLASILKAEQTYKGDNAALIKFWEKLWENGGLKFNGVKWTYRLVDLYVKEKRYDDAFKMLNQLAITRLDYIQNTRQWQIKILKKEKKDYSHIQDLLEKGL